MPSLVQIKPVPPLRQSTIKTLACRRSYKAIFIDGLMPPPSIPSLRGSEVHHVAALYAQYCKAMRVKADWLAFDKIAASVGPEAAEILEGIRENYTVDYEHLVGAEWSFYLDNDFQVPSLALDRQVIIDYSGTLDQLYIIGDHADVPDWKSNFMPFDAPDDQSDLYALAVFQTFPKVQTLTFRFIFVRYKNCERVAEYTREDIPRLIQKFEHHRAVQLAVHERPQNAEAIPCEQCRYCPLLNNGCPIPVEVNRYTKAISERMKLLVYQTYAREENVGILREYVAASGPIEYVDVNGNRFLFGPKETQSRRYPLRATWDALENHVYTESQDPTGPVVNGRRTPDTAFIDTLEVGATKVNQVRKKKSRVHLDRQLQDIAIVVPKHKVELHRPDDVELEEEGDDE